MSDSETFSMCLVSKPIGASEEREVVWLEDGGDKWYNSPGGRSWQSKSESHIVLETATVEDEFELDMTKTSLGQRLLAQSKDDSLAEGWLSPEGEAHYCQHHEQDLYAWYVLRREVRDLEQEGWGRLGRSGDGWVASFGYDYDTGEERQPTEAQAEWLLERMDG